MCTTAFGMFFMSFASSMAYWIRPLVVSFVWCIHSSICVSCMIRHLYYSFIVVICSGGGERPVKENDGVSSCSLSPTNFSSSFLSIGNSEKHQGNWQNIALPWREDSLEFVCLGEYNITQLTQHIFFLVFDYCVVYDDTECCIILCSGLISYIISQVIANLDVLQSNERIWIIPRAL